MKNNERLTIMNKSSGDYPVSDFERRMAMSHQAGSFVERHQYQSVGHKRSKAIAWRAMDYCKGVDRADSARLPPLET